MVRVGVLYSEFRLLLGCGMVLLRVGYLAWRLAFEVAFELFGVIWFVWLFMVVVCFKLVFGNLWLLWVLLGVFVCFADGCWWCWWIGWVCGVCAVAAG